MEFWLSLIILGFGLAVLVAEFILFRAIAYSAEHLLRVFGVTLVVIGSFLLVTAGFSADQIAPAMGLLGTIAGYLLGQRNLTDRQNEPSNISPRQNPPAQ